MRDIENGFHNIEVPPKDMDSLRFLWFNDIKAKELQVIVHWFYRVVVWLQFFTIPLTCMLRHHIRKYEQQDHAVVQQLIRTFFVENLVTRCEWREQALDM